MFRNLFVMFGMFVLLGISVSAQERTWQTFNSPNGDWSILAPGTLKPDTQALSPNSKQGSFTYNDSNGFFAVIYKDHSKLNNLLPWKKGQYNKQRDTVMKANKATLVKDEEFTNGNITGREVRLRMPDNRTFVRETSLKPQPRVQRFRMFFQGNRMYIILAVLPLESISSPEIDKYFTSFKFK